MRFLSLCSGIDAASVALKPQGWTCIGFSEIEPFPSSVLAYHWPEVPNLGDMTKYEDWPIEWADIDALIGGTPCQAFSVAGKGESLDDHRGQLTLTYIKIAAKIDEARARAGRPPAVLWWENVPGVLSTRDNAFGCFLAGLAGEDVPLEPPGGRWTDAGYVRGPRRAVAWRILDAQYFGLAQRRQRVFVVAGAGDVRPEEILFEREGVRRDSPPSREAWQRTASDVAPSLTSSGRGVDRPGESQGQDPVVPCFWNGEQVTQTLDAVLHKGQTMPEKNRFPAVLVPQAIAFKPSHFTRGKDGAPSEVFPPLSADADRGDQEAIIAFHGSQDPDVSGDITHPAGRNQGQETCIAKGTNVRRLTPTETERLQGFPDGHTMVQHRGKPATDSPRYKAIGNSMSVPCMAWIGKRISSHKKSLDSQEA